MSGITGLRLDGEVIHFLTKPKFDLKVPMQSVAFSNFIQQHSQQTDEIFDEEHVAFLTLWLSAYFLCSKSVQVAKACVPLANLLLEGKQLALGQLLLANLYYSTGCWSWQPLLKRGELGLYNFINNFIKNNFLNIKS